MKKHLYFYNNNVSNDNVKTMGQGVVKCDARSDDSTWLLPESAAPLSFTEIYSEFLLLVLLFRP